MSTTKYRPDIDGLRAIAVIPVVLFHAGLTKISGGYVGVDVFFVISGYLITRIVAADIASGEFTIVGFYERRVRRIFPALFALVFSSLLLGYLLFLPRQMKDLGSSAVATTLFSSNILFWLKAGYFDENSALRPLLHTWSLAVEEQYYLLFPPFLFVMLRKLNAKWWVAILPLLLVSLIYSSFAAIYAPASGFYLPQSRAWELLLGSALALWKGADEIATNGRNIAGIAGLAFILAAVLWFSPDTPFPGLAALLPCLGASLIIWSGSRATLTSQILAAAPLRAIGLISYSLYLWHWPIIVFSRYLLMRDLSQGEKAAAVLGSVLLAALSWRFIEQPFRRRSKFTSRPILFPAASSAMAIAVAIGMWSYLKNGLEDRFAPEVRLLAHGALDINPRWNECQGRSPAEILANQICTIGDASAAEPTFVLIGDSFADALMPAVEAEAAAAHVKGVALISGGCYPLVGIRSKLDLNDQCGKFVKASMDYIQRHSSLTRVLLIAR